MIVEFVTKHVFMSSILLFGAVSLFLQAMMSLSLKGYVKASANMKTTRKKLMLNLKNQFETIYGMDYQIRNIAAYVDKYLLKMRFLGLSFSAWEKAPFLTAGLVTLLAGGEAFYGYMTGAGTTVMMEILFAYATVLACLFVFFHIFGIKSRKRQIQIQLVDYLENYLTNRLIRNRESGRELKLLDESMETAFMEGVAQSRELKNVILDEEREGKRRMPAASRDEEERREAEYPAQAVNPESRENMEEDIEMLKRLIREMEANPKEAVQTGENGQTADGGMLESVAAMQRAKAEAEEPESDKAIAATKEQGVSDIELLEEFVQSFLA
ncbi:MAG: hypothetical protein NC300_06610 [Bacteroidales bacterium]|nr:hypothetical protein [Clostridium sp.]MCM1203798.1 hypothetical protein [Bacteroidales bacterium]